MRLSFHLFDLVRSEWQISDWKNRYSTSKKGYYIAQGTIDNIIENNLKMIYMYMYN